jgi:hypothetical protein
VMPLTWKKRPVSIAEKETLRSYIESRWPGIGSRGTAETLQS